MNFEVEHIQIDFVYRISTAVCNNDIQESIKLAYFSYVSDFSLKNNVKWELGVCVCVCVCTCAYVYA